MSKRAPVNIEGDLAALISSALLNEQSTSLTTILKLLSKDGDALEVTRAWSLLQSYYRALYDRSADVVFTLDAEARILAVNTSGQIALGRPASSLIATELSALLEPESGSALVGLLWSGFEGVSDSVVVLLDGRRMRFSVSRLAEGISLLIFRDATRFHQLEQALQKSRGLANIGNLAADLAYGISNPLAVIQGRIELLMSSPQVDPLTLRRQRSVRGGRFRGGCTRLNAACRRGLRGGRAVHQHASHHYPAADLAAHIRRRSSSQLRRPSRRIPRPLRTQS